MYLYETVNFFSIERDSMGLAECRSHRMQAQLDQWSTLLLVAFRAMETIRWILEILPELLQMRRLRVDRCDIKKKCLLTFEVG